MNDLLEILRLAGRRGIAGAAVLSLLCQGFPAVAQETETATPDEGGTSTEAEPSDEDIPLEEEELEEEEEVSYSNWVEFGGGGTIVNGDKARFQQRTGLPGGAFGGLPSFHYERFLNSEETTQLKMDGRAIFPNEGYGLRLELSEMDKYFIRGGYDQSRTYYDGSGGYFPGPDPLWFDLYDDEFHLDRKEAWVEGGIVVPDYPRVTLRYSRWEREGQKGATQWGDATTQVPFPSRS